VRLLQLDTSVDLTPDRSVAQRPVFRSRVTARRPIADRRQLEQP
jgi:hypothetical protein